MTHMLAMTRNGAPGQANILTWMETADVSLGLPIQVLNILISAYREMMRMPL